MSAHLAEALARAADDRDLLVRCTAALLAAQGLPPVRFDNVSCVRGFEERVAWFEKWLREETR